MKIIRYILLPFIVLYIGMTYGFAQSAPINMLQDMAIPLMDGLTENQDEAFLFDSPDGSIIAAQASGTVSPKAAFDYYRVVLPSLGWVIEDDNTKGLICEDGAEYCFMAVRDEESLVLNILSEGQNSVLTYSLSPN
jgi:hypothetical protein